MKKNKKLRVFDFFSGCGGTSNGFEAAGFEIVFGLDLDSDASQTFQKNFPKAKVLSKDIRKVTVDILDPFFKKRDAPVLFCGCAPCQPFSRQNGHKRGNDPRRNLLSYFSKFVEYWKPDYVFVENVPGLQGLPASGPLKRFIKSLEVNGYHYDVGVLPALWFGVPQTRERLVLLASKDKEISLPLPTHGNEPGLNPYATVRDLIYRLPKLGAGETHSVDQDHQSSSLSALNQKRISATPQGGGREAWPKRLWLDCHKGYSGHTDVYGRLAWDKPASGLTTRCISYSNGRFGHPSQNRAISVREAACLQTFPTTYGFHGSLSSRARQIGNAVPPLMAKSIGLQVLKHAADLSVSSK